MAIYTPLKQYDSASHDHGADYYRAKKLHRIALIILFAGLTTFGLSLFNFNTRHPFVNVESAQSRVTDKFYTESIERCVANTPPAASPPAPVNIWASLSVEETYEIRRWLESPLSGLNITSGDRAVLNDNYIFGIEALRPPKAKALAYLNSPEPDLLPERFAKVIIQHGAAVTPTIKEYLVGPLPVSPSTGISELKNIYHRDDIPFNARSIYDTSELSSFIVSYMSQLAEATQELFGGTILGLDNATLIAGLAGPWSFDGSFRRMWVSWRYNVPGPWLHPINFYHYIDASGTDISQWKLLKIVYNHQIFPSAKSFLEAFRNGTLKRLPKRPDQRQDPSWSSRKRVGHRLDLNDLPGPRSVSFAGLRFRVDQKQQYVSWMGWGFYLGFNRDMGTSLWDIRFREERIIYELSPQEAIAIYAGQDPSQGSTAWLDSYFGMGLATRDMFPGYDCPHEAVFFSATVHTAEGSSVRERGICVFEQDTGRPLTRHLGFTEGESGAVKGYVLTVRSISTVGNYDYLFDYMFQIDGTIEVRLSASGYLQAGFWEDSQEGYGSRIRETTMGSLHDHIINYKVDLDVAGLENSLLHTSTAQEEIPIPWIDEDHWGDTIIQQKITREYITNEDKALLKYPLNFQGGYAIVNKEAKNKWNYPRGYSIHAGMNPIHNTVIGSKKLLKNAEWARYNMAVSRRKDTEPASSSMWNLNLPGAPAVNFHKFFDSENIDQEDLVAWINVGTHHLPQAEDIPNTRTNTASSSFYLTPLNYFDYDVSIDASDAILLNPPEEPGGLFTFDDYGVKPKICLPQPIPTFKYSGMKTFGIDGKSKILDFEELKNQAMSHQIRVDL